MADFHYILTSILILINRLANAGFTDWLMSYITDRSSCISIDDKRSNWCKQNSLMLNESKYNAMFINFQKKSTPIKFSITSLYNLLIIFLIL